MIYVVEWPECLSHQRRISCPIYPPLSGVRIDVEHVREWVNHITSIGFPEPKIYVMQCSSESVFGQETGGMVIYIFAMSPLKEYVFRILGHEYGHTVEKNWVTGRYWEGYWNIRQSGLPIPDQALRASGGKSEIFAEDFRFLFAPPGPVQEPHTKRHFVGDLGYSLPEVIQELGGWKQRREKLKALIMEAVKQKAPPVGEASKFSDISGHWAESAILKVAEMGLMNGYPDGTFGPNKPVTRAEIAAILARLIERSMQNG